MSSKLYKSLLIALAIVLVVVSGQVQKSLNHDRDGLGLSRYTELKGAPPVLALTTVALGGFRGLISNALWIRANDLQDEGKYFEMVQLADWITKLEPHFTQVWLVQAWNMAYNISVKFKDFGDRWRWVQRGIELLRDDGLRYNPHDVLIHRELSWFFQHKMGAFLDDAHNVYKLRWAMDMNTVFGTNGAVMGSTLQQVNWEDYIHPKTTNQLNMTYLLTNKYKIDPVLAKEVDEHYGPLEWRLPEAHAIYWAKRGLNMAALNERKINPEDLITLRRVIYQDMQLSFQRGRLIADLSDSTHKRFDYGPNLDIIPNVSASYEEMMKDDEKNKDHIETGHRNFIRQAVFDLYTYNRIEEATKWFKYLGERYPQKSMIDGRPESLPGTVSLFQYITAQLEEEVRSTGKDKAQTIVEGMERTAMVCLARGEEDRFIGFKNLGERFYQHYQGDTPDMSTNRVALAPLRQIQQEVFQRLVERRGISQGGIQQVITVMHLDPPILPTNAVPTEASAPAPTEQSAPPVGGPATNSPAEKPK